MNDEIKNVSFIFPKGSLEDDWREEALRHRKEILQLKSQLQQKENIIKEVREYIKLHIRKDEEYPDYMEMLKYEYKELLEILDKENKGVDYENI